MEDFEGQFATLSIAKRSEQTKDPTYLLDIDCPKTAAGAGNQQLVAVSCSNRSIHVYNKQTLGLVGQYSGHSGPVCGVRFAQTSDNLLFSASGDGTVRCWDVRTPGIDAVQVFRGYPSNVFSSFDVNCSDLVICAGTEKVHEDTFMVFWDARVVKSNSTAGPQPLGVYSESHNDDITQVRFHPSKSDMVVSGSTDGLVNVFDIGTDTEDDALLATCNSDSSVSSINWSGEQYDQICCLTHDEGLFWWDLAQLETEEPITLLSVQDARETTEIQGGSLDYLIRGMYHERAKKLVVVGGTNTGKLHLLDCRVEGLRHMCALQDSHSATVRCFHWHTGDDSAHCWGGCTAPALETRCCRTFHCKKGLDEKCLLHPAENQGSRQNNVQKEEVIENNSNYFFFFYEQFLQISVVIQKQGDYSMSVLLFKCFWDLFTVYCNFILNFYFSFGAWQMIWTLLLANKKIILLHKVFIA